METGFIGKSPTNDVIVLEVQARLDELRPHLGGKLLKIHGPGSQQAAWVMADELKPLYKTVAIFDRDIPAFVVVIPRSKRGQKIPVA